MIATSVSSKYVVSSIDNPTGQLCAAFNIARERIRNGSASLADIQRIAGGIWSARDGVRWLSSIEKSETRKDVEAKLYAVFGFNAKTPQCSPEFAAGIRQLSTLFIHDRVERLRQERQQLFNQEQSLLDSLSNA